jgi:hypothetical protein
MTHQERQQVPGLKSYQLTRFNTFKADLLTIKGDCLLEAHAADFQMLDALTPEQFVKALEDNFEGIEFKSQAFSSYAVELSEKCKQMDENYFKKRSGVFVDLKSCVACGKPHRKYEVKVDANKVPYVICGTGRKRLNVALQDKPLPKKLNSLKALSALVPVQIVTVVEDLNDKASQIFQVTH